MRTTNRLETRTIITSAAIMLAMATAASAQELLINGDFEAGEPNSDGAPGWITYNPTFTTGEYARSEGGKSFKAYGPWFQGGGSVGLQSVAAVPGKSYSLTGYMFSPALDAIQGSNFGLLELRFLDADLAVIPGTSVAQQFTVASGFDAWVPYNMQSLAPANTAFAEVVIGHIQANQPVTGGAIFIDDVSLTEVIVLPESNFIGTASGSWTEPSNWQNNQVPNAIGAIANFNATINAPSTVSANSAVTVGSIRLNSPVAYTLGGTGGITIDVATGAGSINVTQGNHTISTALTLNDSAVANVAASQTLTLGGTVNLANGSHLSTAGAGTLRITGAVTGSTGATVRANGGILQADVNLGANVDVVSDAGEVRFGTSQRVRSLSVATGAKATLSDVASPTVLRTASLTINGQLDLGDNAAVIDYDGASPFTSVREAILAGRISASKAVSDSRYAIGYAEASAVGSPTTFAGETGIDASTILLRVTLKGDADLSGIVGFEDLLLLAQNYGGSDKVWSQGDSDGNGLINFSDLLALAQNYNQSALTGEQVASLGSDFAADFRLAMSMVPEPATLSILAGIGAMTLRRRR